MERSTEEKKAHKGEIQRRKFLYGFSGYSFRRICFSGEWEKGEPTGLFYYIPTFTSILCFMIFYREGCKMTAKKRRLAFGRMKGRTVVYID